MGEATPNHTRGKIPNGDPGSRTLLRLSPKNTLTSAAVLRLGRNLT